MPGPSCPSWSTWPRAARVAGPGQRHGIPAVVLAMARPGPGGHRGGQVRQEDGLRAPGRPGASAARPEARAGRLEDLAPLGADLGVAKAVGSLELLTGWWSRHGQAGAPFLALKRPDWSQEPLPSRPGPCPAPLHPAHPGAARGGGAGGAKRTGPRGASVTERIPLSGSGCRRGGSLPWRGASGRWPSRCPSRPPGPGRCSWSWSPWRALPVAVGTHGEDLGPDREQDVAHLQPVLGALVDDHHVAIAGVRVVIAGEDHHGGVRRLTSPGLGVGPELQGHVRRLGERHQVVAHLDGVQAALDDGHGALAWAG